MLTFKAVETNFKVVKKNVTTSVPAADTPLVFNRLSHPVFKPKENISYFKPQNKMIIATKRDDNDEK